jgi:excisionase family DNA binding protein
MQHDRFVGKNEAAEFLGCAPVTVQIWAARGLLPSVKVRRRRLYRLSELEAWVRAQNHPRNRASDTHRVPRLTPPTPREVQP